MHLQDANKENEMTITELKEKMDSGNDRTPLKVNLSFGKIHSPRTPKTPKTPSLGTKSPSILMSPLRVRNN